MNKVISIENKIIINQAQCLYIRCNDVNKDEWSEEPCEVTKDIRKFCCLKLPQY